jgi:hypothetical protein
LIKRFTKDSCVYLPFVSVANAKAWQYIVTLPKKEDRRTSLRHTLQLTCRISSDGALADSIKALTENVSRSGILVRWLKGMPLPEVGGSLTLDVQLPKNPEMAPRVMRCRTTVVRVVPGSGQEHEVALRVRAMRFVAAKQPAATCDLAAILIPNKFVM